jgi:5-methyltetrahydropteroyltriglutamate--homocysteine methyltransferase
LRRALKFVKPEHLYGCTNCGMVPLSRAVANAKLQALVAGAEIVSKELG